MTVNDRTVPEPLKVVSSTNYPTVRTCAWGTKFGGPVTSGIQRKSQKILHWLGNRPLMRSDRDPSQRPQCTLARPGVRKFRA